MERSFERGLIHKIMEYVIEVKNLIKHYNKLCAVNNISFEVKKVKFLVCLVKMVQERQPH